MAQSPRRSVAALPAEKRGPQLVKSAPVSNDAGPAPVLTQTKSTRPAAPVLTQTQNTGQALSPDKSTRPAAPVVQIDAGDHRERLRARRDELVEQYAGMVPPIAERIKRRAPDSFDIDDLIQEGLIGLMYAAARYQPEEHDGTPFSAYARQRVVGAMLDYISGRNWKFAKMSDPLPDQNRPYTVGRFSNGFQFGSDETVIQTAADRYQARIMKGMKNEPDLDEAIDARRKLRQAEDAIAYLDVRSQRVLDGYFREEKTLEAVGESVGYSRQTAGEIRDAALKKVKLILHVVEKK